MENNPNAIFPTPPGFMPGQQPTPMYQQTVYDMYGRPIQVESYAPQPMYYPQQPMYQSAFQHPQQMPITPSSDSQIESSGITLGSSKLMNKDVYLDIPDNNNSNLPKAKVNTGTAVSKSVRKSDVAPAQGQNSQPEIATVQYADTYQDTTNWLKTTVAQADELAADIKSELDQIRSARTLKGKYTYITNMSSALSAVLGTKIMAIREINSTIKNINDQEYRRYKDNRAIETQDDNKMIMDMYNAYIHTPVGTADSAYRQPTTLDITAGLNVVPVERDKNDPKAADTGFNAYMNNLTPEQNLMLQESNPDIQQVIVYDQASGKKYFDWINIRTGESVPNMPATDPMFLEDYTIDPKTRLARNLNLNKTLKVIYKNEGAFSQY